MSTLRTFIEHTGPARLDRRTKNLVRRLTPEDVAIIDHTDLDRVSAEELIESGVRVVVNVAVPSRLTDEQRSVLEQFERLAGEDTYRPDESFLDKLRAAFR